jgi:hypothetical protein
MNSYEKGAMIRFYLLLAVILLLMVAYVCEVKYKYVKHFKKKRHDMFLTLIHWAVICLVSLTPAFMVQIYRNLTLEFELPLHSVHKTIVDNEKR